MRDPGGLAVEINRLLLAKFFYVEDVFFEGAIFPELFLFYWQFSILVATNGSPEEIIFSA